MTESEAPKEGTQPTYTPKETPKAEVSPPAPQATSSPQLDIDKLLKDIEVENNAKLNQTKTDAINEAQNGMISADTVKQLLTKVNEAHETQMSETLTNFNTQMTELKDTVVTQKGTINQSSNPNTPPTEAYNPWKDNQVSDAAKVELLIKHIRRGNL